MNVSNCDVCILIFIEGGRIAGKKWEFFSLSGVFLSLLLPSSKWAPIPSLFRMITDRYNKNGNIRPLCTRQLATGMNASSGPLLPFFSCAPWTRHLYQAHRHKGHVTCEIGSYCFSLSQVQVSVLKYISKIICMSHLLKVFESNL